MSNPEIKTTAELAQLMVEVGAMTVNEARAIVGMDDLQHAMVGTFAIPNGTNQSSSLTATAVLQLQQETEQDVRSRVEEYRRTMDELMTAWALQPQPPGPEI
jgi:hypothetical protein